MHAYCVHVLKLSEEAAFKRIRAARTARRFPAIFTALAAGRVNLNTVVLLAPHLSEDTADELLAAATHKTRSEIEQLLAQRFPQPDAPFLAQPIAALSIGCEQSTMGHTHKQLAARPVGVSTPTRVAPLSPQRFVLQVTVGQATHDKLRHAQALLGHQIPSGDVAQVLDRALDTLIQKLEQRKLAATAKPRIKQRPTTSRRHIPARVRRAVWERDRGQCTYMSASGRRCTSRTRLEFDHVDEVSRGGTATVEGVRLRCRAHNQYGAECTFGKEFMSHKRHEAAARAAEARNAKAQQLAARPVEAVPEDRDVVPWLRQLGFNAREARSAAALCSDLTDAPLEQRVRVALRYFHPRAHAAVRRE
jgi:hypothetical protein